MTLLAIAFPMLPDRMDQFQHFVRDLAGPKKAEFAAARLKLGVRERSFHQQTPQGDMVVVTLEGDDPAGALAKFGQGTDPFSTWFRERVMEIHGVDLSAPPPSPLPELVADSGA